MVGTPTNLVQGAIGRGPDGPIDMATVADVMTKEVITITPETPIRELAELLYTRRISGVPV